MGSDAKPSSNDSIDVAEMNSSVTIMVRVQTVKVGRGETCAGVGLQGTPHTTVAHPGAGRQIAHGKVTGDGVAIAFVRPAATWTSAAPRRACFAAETTDVRVWGGSGIRAPDAAAAPGQAKS
jgi:hypothetical protein